VRPVVCAPRRLCAPSFLLLIASLLANISLVSPTQAQTSSSGTSLGTYYWSTTAADGTVTKSPTYANGKFTSSNGQYFHNYYLLGSYGTPPYGNGDGEGLTNVTCSGEIDTTYTWATSSGQTPTDPPPASVIVEETSTAYGYGWNSDGSDPTGNFDNGLKVSYSLAPGDNGHANCTSTRYTVQAGGMTVPLTCSPSIQVTAEASEIHVDYTPTIFPVTIKITGTNNPTAGDYRALTGQQIMATLNGIPSGVKVTSYTWGFSGGTSGNPIKNWDGTNNTQQLFPLTSADLTGTDTTGNGISVNPVSFYDEIDKDAVTVTCAINLTFPDGTTGTVNAVSPQITFMKPTAVWHVDANDPSYHGPPPGPYFDGTQMGYIEMWDATITVPSPFSGGSGCFTQIVSPTIQFQRYPLNNKSTNCYFKVPQTNADGTITYVLPTSGLDTAFPYQIGSSAYSAYPNGYTWDVSTTGISADTPSVGFSIPASDNGGNNWYTAFDSDTFTTWLMYMLPSSATGSGMTIWVPLQRVDWHWTGNVVKNTATGVWNAAQSGNSPVTGSTSNPGVPTDTPPQWSSVNAVKASVLYP